MHANIPQAGNVGVLNGAERFDNKRGYKFSTYVQYWIRKSMLAVIARHSKGIQLPVCLCIHTRSFKSIICASQNTNVALLDTLCLLL